MRKLIVSIILLLSCATIGAQVGTGVIISYQVEVFDISVDPNATGKALWTMTVPAASALCNLAPLPAPKTLTQYNPQGIYWTDLVNTGKVCKISAVLLGTLPVLGSPTNYILTVSSVDDRGWYSARSNVSMPFNNTVPAALIGVMVR